MTKNLGGVSIDLPSGGVVLIEPIGEIDELVARAEANDLLAVSEYSQKRQCEGLTWRSMVRNRFPDDNIILSYSYAGAPQLSVKGRSSDLYLGVSHSAQYVAVIISPIRCSIDIERLDRDFSKVASRYISPCEARLVSPNLAALALLWSAKETLYKYAGRKELSLLDDIRIEKLTAEYFEGIITPHTTLICGTATTFADHTLVYIG